MKVRRFGGKTIVDRTFPTSQTFQLSELKVKKQASGIIQEVLEDKGLTQGEKAFGLIGGLISLNIGELSKMLDSVDPKLMDDLIDLLTDLDKASTHYRRAVMKAVEKIRKEKENV